MKKLLTTTSILFALAGPALADAKTLPDCNMLQIGKAFSNILNNEVMFFDMREIDRNSPALQNVRSAQDDMAKGKKFCFANFASPHTSYGYRRGGPFQQAIFSLEWTNEAEGKFWLQIVKQQDYRDPNFDYSKFFKFAPDAK